MSKYNFISSEKTLFSAILVEIACLIILVVLSAYFLWMQQISQNSYKTASQLRYDSYILADQLRHSSDDLTRMVRSYAATGNAIFEDYYFDILAIREGKEARPEHYERVYWDFMTVKQPVKPFPDGAKVSLETLMRQAGFTKKEFQLLADAKENSDRLIALEQTAMHAMKGEFQDSNGGFTVRGEPDPERALKIVFGEPYHAAKKSIMQPINEFFQAIDQRTSENVSQAVLKVGFKQKSMVALFCLLLVNGLMLFLTIKRHQTLTLRVRKKNEDNLKAAQKIAKLGHWELDLRTNRLTWSDEIYRIFEIHPSNFRASYQAFVEMVHPDDRAMVHRKYTESVKDKKPYSIDHRLLLKDGRVKFVQEQGETFYDDQGNSLRTVGIVQDITEIRKAGKEKIALERQLRRAQKLEAIGTLAGGIAHDFNNILSPIIGYSEMLSEDIPKESPLQEMVINIFNGARRARDLVHQLLTLSRETEHELKPLRVHLVVSEACRLIKSTMPSTIEFRRNLDKNCGLILADPTQLHQITMNLITNAFHAMEDSGGKLEIDLEEVELTKEDFKAPDMKSGRYVCLSVCDTGKGIHRNDLDRIFDPYFTTKAVGKGTGLGLSIVHSLVQSYNGEIMVYSEPGKGTVFKIFLPVIESAESPDVINESIDHLKGSESILVVDDDSDILSLEKSILERLGYNVTAIDNSPDSLEIFMNNPHAFDIVITDMTMPKMTGDLLAQKIMDIRPDISVVLCTGFSEKMSKEKAKEAGFKGFIMKPIIRKEIARTIRRALGDAVE